MAVTATFTRTSHTDDTATITAFITAALSGTYATGGFAFNPGAVLDGPGSSAIGGAVKSVQFISPLGYIYYYNAGTGKIQIFSAPGTELANSTSVPDASVTVIVRKSKV